ncbi:MAG: nucleotide pyrophosphohydrolase [Phycisphaerae bacterium]
MEDGNPSGAGATVQDTTTTVAALIQLVDDFVAERCWQPFHDPKNLSASFALEAAELMEHFQWLRSDQLDSVREDPQAMEHIREELADVVAYVLSFASMMGIDVSSALADKLKKNAVKYPVEQYRGRFKA